MVLSIPALKAKIVAYLYNNTTHDITGQDAQDICTDIVDSLNALGGGLASNIAPYDNAFTYVGGQTYYVSYGGNVWLFTSDTDSTGNTPPTLPTTSNAWWELSSVGAGVLFTLLTGFSDLPQTAAVIDDNDYILSAFVKLQAQITENALGLWDDRGNHSAGGGAYPSTGGSGPAGAIMKGDTWRISVAGTLPTGQVVGVGDVIRALVDTPGNTQANWAILEANIGYVPEDEANKDTDGTLAANSDTKYASQKAVKTYIDNRVPRQAVFATNFAGTVVTFRNTTGSTGGTGGVATGGPTTPGVYTITMTGANFPITLPIQVKVDIQNFVTGGQNGLGGNVSRRYEVNVLDADTLTIRVFEQDDTNNVDETPTNYDWTTKSYPDGNVLITVTIN